MGWNSGVQGPRIQDIIKRTSGPSMQKWPYPKEENWKMINYLYCSIEPKVVAWISYRKNDPTYIQSRALGLSQCQQGRQPEPRICLADWSPCFPKNWPAKGSRGYYLRFRLEGTRRKKVRWEALIPDYVGYSASGGQLGSNSSQCLQGIGLQLTLEHVQTMPPSSPASLPSISSPLLPANPAGRIWTFMVGQYAQRECPHSGHAGIWMLIFDWPHWHWIRCQFGIHEPDSSPASTTYTLENKYRSLFRRRLGSGVS
jgi:hypothetical protein